MFFIALTHCIYSSEINSPIFCEFFSISDAKNFEKITHGTFNQSNSEFGETARTKAASKPLTAEMSVRKGLPSWKMHICLMA